MAWTNVPTFTSGAILTAAQMNGLGGNLDDLRGDYGRFKRTAGDITLTGTTSWSNLTTIGTAIDLTLAAEAGDIVEYAVSFQANNDAVSTGFDVVTCNGPGGAAINSFAADAAAPAIFNDQVGIQAWLCLTGVTLGVGGSAFRKLVSGDIVSGAVTLRLRYACAAATGKTIRAGVAQPFEVWARNHGQVEI